MKLKYIRTRLGYVIFSGIISHRDVARGLSEIESAGMCYIDAKEGKEGKLQVTCYGESVTLGLSSMGGDSEILTRKLNEQY